MRFRNRPKAENLNAFGEGHKVTHPPEWRAGVVFASPHSGSIYPADLLARSNLSAHQLRRNEDIFIDDLFRSAVAAGAPFLQALFPRVFVDVNRAESELPSQWEVLLDAAEYQQPTPRAAAGLGVLSLNWITGDFLKSVWTRAFSGLPLYARICANGITSAGYYIG